MTTRCAVVTLSDTRTAETDASGRLIRELLEADGHQVAAYHLIKDDPEHGCKKIEVQQRAGVASRTSTISQS